jgi:ribosomal protein S18 acetylase RimI-like enzyme
MEIRSTGFRTDLRVLELGGSEVEDRGTHLVVRTPDNPNFYWGNFFLLREPPVPGGEREVVAAFHTEFPRARHVALGIDGTEDLGDSLEPFVDAGLSVEGATVLTATSLVGPGSPERAGEAADAEEGVEVRPLESDDDWEQRAQLDLVVDDLTPDADVLDFVRNRVASWRRLVDGGHATWWGALEEGRLLSTCGIVRTSEGEARYQSVATHPHARRRGLAAAVVHAAGSRALADGARTLVIVAETDGSAMRLYQRLGLTGEERQTQLFRSP